MIKILLIPLTILFFTIAISLHSEGLEAPPTPKLEKPPQTGFNENNNEINSSESPLSPPPAVRLKVKPPANEEEAFKRIKDYKIFKQILPPGAAPKDMEKRFFGKYIEKVKPYIENNNEESIEDIVNENYSPPNNSSMNNSKKAPLHKNKKNSKSITSENGVSLKQKKTSPKIYSNIHPKISKKLRDEILKKYTTQDIVTPPKKTEIHLAKYKYYSYNFAIILTVLWGILFAGLIYRRKL